MKTILLSNLVVLALIFSPVSVAEPVGITPEMSSVEVLHKGKPVKIERN